MGYFIMSVKFREYCYEYRIASLALDNSSKEKLIERELSVLYVDDTEVVLLPDEVVLSKEFADIEQLRQYNNYDVVEIWENGVVNRRYNDQSDDNYFFVTGSCNSNCIMCPSPDVTRKNVPQTNISELIELARHIPTDAPHLTITGGEPFLIGECIFPFIQYLKERFSDTDFLFLTNGRIFAVEKYLRQFVEKVPYKSIVAIPIHGSCESIHDSITRADGSFKQTKQGIKKLLKNHIQVEIRLVISRLNIYDFDKIADLIIEEFKGIEYVSVIAMEMTGNARVNKEQVWISYRQSMEVIASSLKKMIENGVDVKLYNFPICTVQKQFWTLCEKSISESKVRFAESCKNCKYKTACGGVFAGTFQLERDELKAIL
jgi:His-Xaa-Ser system radical SAM maturase HxsC